MEIRDDMLAENIERVQKSIEGKNCTLIAVTKTHPIELLQEAYDLGLRVFGENKAQEMSIKYDALPKDIQWHMIGHLQTNKVKYIAPYVSLIHSVDGLGLLKEINKQAIKNERVISCLLQIYIAKEETKFGLSFEEAEDLLTSEEFKQMNNITIIGLMGMATNTDQEEIVKSEFKSLKIFFEKLKINHPTFKVLSMGMSGDYQLAIEEGSNMVRVGSAIFGNRTYLTI